MPRRRLLACLVWCVAGTAGPAWAQVPSTRLDVPVGGGLVLDEVDVAAKRLDAARSQILPGLGATTFSFSRQAIEILPLGDNAPLSQVLLQAPGVAQDSFGQIHVRGDHADIQYRINGVQLPEGLAGFGAVLKSRFARSAKLVTGALPAQYGFRTAGVIDIETKTGLTNPGLTVSLYGGSRGYAQPSFEYGGREGAFDYYATGEYLQNNIGIENPTNGFAARHDMTHQGRGFAYASHLIDDSTRISLISGSFYGDFQIPTRGGIKPSLGLAVNGVADFNGADLQDRQREFIQFGILSLQKHTGLADAQVSLFTRYSSLRFSPDPLELWPNLGDDGLRKAAYRGG